MLKFNLPRPGPINLLLDSLTANQIDIYLFGYLPGSDLLFVDIDWKASEKLSGQQVPQGWTLIYPFFLSSDAICRGEPDPLMQGISITDIVQTYQPKGLHPVEIEQNMESLVSQAEYLMQFPPSRLVWLEPSEPTQEQIDQLISTLL